MSRWKLERVLPWLILVLALGIRLWGINFSLPFIYHVDEERFSQISLNYLRGDPNPHFFHVPSLYTYAVAGIWKLHYLAGHLLGLGGRFESKQAFISGFGRNPTSYILLGRLLTVVLSVGTVLALYFLGKYIAGPWVGALAAFVLIFSPEHNKISHYLVPDSPMVFFLVLSYLQIFKIYERGKLRHYLLSGAFAGLAFTTKYGGHFLILPLLLAQFFRNQEKKGKLWRGLLHEGLLVWGISFLLVFLIGTPYALLDYRTFWRDFRWQSSHLFSLGHFGSSTAQPAWLFYLQYGFAENTGLLFQFFIYAGIIGGFIRHRKKDVILLSFPVLLFILMGTWKTRATRYLLPLAPFFILIGAMAFDEIVAFLKQSRAKIIGRRKLVPTQAAASVFIFLLLLPPTWKVVRFNISLTQEDTRTTAKHWIEANIPPGTRIALESYCPQISRTRYRITYRHALYQVDLDWLARRRIDYIIISDIMYARFTRYPQEFPQEAKFYQSLEEKAVLVKTFRPRWDEYLLDLHNPTLKIYRLSRLPDTSFPGNFKSYSQLVRLKKIDGIHWEIETSLQAIPWKQNEEAIQNIYLRGEDRWGKEIFLFSLYPGLINSDQEIKINPVPIRSKLVPGTKLYLGYEISFLRLPLAEKPATPYHKEMQLAEISRDLISRTSLEYHFYYRAWDPVRGEDYFQKIILSSEGDGWRIKSSVYGGKLRYGNDSVLNPWVEIIDSAGKQVQKIIVFPGLLGSMEGATKGPAEIDQIIGLLPADFKVAIGYDGYSDQELPAAAGGPRRILLDPPPGFER